MSATIIYRLGYPRTDKPIESSFSIGSDGLVTGSALFLINPNSRPFSVNQQIAQSIFPGLNNQQLRTLFVESFETYKRAALTYSKVNVLGLLRQTFDVRTSEWSARSYSKTDQFIVANSQGEKEVQDLFYSFDYYSETISISAIREKTNATMPSPPTAKFGQKWNEKAGGSLVQIAGQGMSAQSAAALLAPTQRQIVTTSTEERGNLLFIRSTIQAVYE